MSARPGRSLIRSGDVLLHWVEGQLSLVRLGSAQRIAVPVGATHLLDAFSVASDPDEIAARFGRSTEERDAILGNIADLERVGALRDASRRYDEVYFDAFSGLVIHETMLRDGPRLTAYAQAIAARVKPGDTVIDAGTGTGVLAMLAARAGAAKVYAVDRARVGPIARELFARNGLDDRIEFVQSDLDDFTPSGQVDVIVSETFGHLGHVEGTVLALGRLARRTLRPGGALIPEALEVHAAPLSDPETHRERIGTFGQPLHGLDFSMVRATVLSSARSDRCIAPSTLLAPAQCANRHELATREDEAWEKQLLFTADRAGPFDAIGLYFDLDLGAGVKLSTAFDAPPTHWHQTWVPVEPMMVAQGDAIGARIRLSPAARELRKVDLDVHCGLLQTHRLDPEYRARVFVR